MNYSVLHATGLRATDWQEEDCAGLADAGLAEVMHEEKASDPPETKGIDGAPENKAEGDSDEADDDHQKPHIEEGDKGWFKVTWPNGETKNMRKAELVEAGLIEG